MDRRAGFIRPSRVDSYKEIVSLVVEKAAPARLRVALLNLANQLKNQEAGVFSSAPNLEPEQLVSEFEERLQEMLQE